MCGPDEPAGENGTKPAKQRWWRNGSWSEPLGPAGTGSKLRRSEENTEPNKEGL